MFTQKGGGFMRTIETAPLTAAFMSVTDYSDTSREREPNTNIRANLQRLAKNDFPGGVRVSFGGLTKQGRGGVSLIAKKHKKIAVTGHKMHPIPEALLDQVSHFSLRDWQEAFKVLWHDKHDVLIGDEKDGILLRWVGTTVEVYGSGIDTEIDHHNVTGEHIFTK